MKHRRKLLPAAAAIAIVAAGTGYSQGIAKPTLAAPLAITAKEKAEGAKAHPELLKEFGGAYQAPQTAYVVRTAQAVAVQSGLGNARADFTVTLLNSPVNNAFAIPGGYIYITRQLVALCNDEAEMAGVLGHEVGHVAARHSKQRQRAATQNAIVGILGQVVGGLIGDNGGLLGALGGGLQKYSGTVANLLTLKYSRSQEEQADDLGIKYLSGAGYDPQALSTMLTSLALQTNVDAAASGAQAGSVPEWASTHPEPAKRVARAAAGASRYAQGGLRNRAQHLAAIDGMLFGDDPHQGVVDGRNFVHPDMRLKFAIPAGFAMQNGADAVSISGQGGQAQFSGGAYDGNLDSYVAKVFQSVAGKTQVNIGELQRTTVNGIKAGYATARANTQSGQVDVTVFAYEFSPTQAFHFVTLVPVGSDPFRAMYSSLSRMTTAEAAAVKPRMVRVMTVKRGDTVASLSAKMAYADLKEARFRALNGLGNSTALTQGQQVKIVTY